MIGPLQPMGEAEAAAFARAALERLEMAWLVELRGISALATADWTADLDDPRTPAIEPGDGQDAVRLVRAIHTLEPTLNPEQRQLFTAVVAGAFAHAFDLAAPDARAREARERSRLASDTGRMASAALELADRLWGEDPTIRTGEMVAMVQNRLVAEGFRRPSARAVRGWLECLTPDEAKRPGRPRKSGKSASGNISDRS